MRKHTSVAEIPPPLELECLKVLWTLGEASVKEVRTGLTQNRNLAYTTVMTVLDRLSKKNGVTRRKVGRSFVYSPRLDREKLRHLAVKDLVDAFFDGSQDSLADWLKHSNLSDPVLVKPKPAASEQQAQEQHMDTSLL